MKLTDLKPAPGSKPSRKRIGCGAGSGHGKTACRGENGQKSRSGGKLSPRFEGGQMPLVRRIPKRGFKSINRVEYQVVNVRDLEKVDGDVSPETLKAAGLVRSLKKPVKILAVGEVSKKVAVTAHKFSASAQAKIEAAGGSVTLIASTTSDA